MSSPMDLLPKCPQDIKIYPALPFGITTNYDIATDTIILTLCGWNQRVPATVFHRAQSDPEYMESIIKNFMETFNKEMSRRNITPNPYDEFLEPRRNVMVYPKTMPDPHGYGKPVTPKSEQKGSVVINKLKTKTEEPNLLLLLC